MAPRSATMSGGKVIPASSSSGGVSALGWLFVVLGSGFLLFFALALITQVQTNEAFELGGGQVSAFQPNWPILLQVPQMIFGGAQVSNVTVMVGWGVEMIYLGFTLGYDLLHQAAGFGGATMGRIFKVLSWAIVFFNCWTDGNFGTVSFASGLAGHIIFAAITATMVAFFGKIGLFFITHGLRMA